MYENLRTNPRIEYIETYCIHHINWGNWLKNEHAAVWGLFTHKCISYSVTLLQHITFTTNPWINDRNGEEMLFITRRQRFCTCFYIHLGYISVLTYTNIITTTTRYIGFYVCLLFTWVESVKDGAQYSARRLVIRLLFYNDFTRAVHCWDSMNGYIYLEKNRIIGNVPNFL